MPFNSMDQVQTRDKYITQLKKELKGMTENELGEFYFFDGVDLGAGEQSFILLGSVKDGIVKELRSKAKSKATGNCFREGGTLNLTLATGKMPEAKLKPLFKETKTYGFKLVDGAPDQLDDKGDVKDEEKKVRAIIGGLESAFDKVKGKIGDDYRKDLRIRFGEIETALTAKDWAKVRKLAVVLDKVMTGYVKEMDPKSGGGDSREKANAMQRWKDAMARFDKAKSVLTDDERKAVRVLWGKAEDKLKAEDWAGTIKAVEAVDKELAKVVKEALKGAQTSEGEASKKIGDGLSAKGKELVKKLDQQAKQLETLRQAMLGEMKAVESIRQELRDEEAKPIISGPLLNDIKNRLDAKKKTLDGAKKALEAQRKEMGKTEAELKSENSLTDRDTVAKLDRAKKTIADLEDVLQSTPMDQARDELKETAKKMAEATKWREEQLKKEATPGGGHATGRHGAQTGMERQARRAATSEEYVDPADGKTKKRGGLTPDQPGNVSGAPQSVAWNKVKFTYTEKDGKREIKDRTKVAKALAGAASREAGSLSGSMWATPTLEKECFDAANGYAAKLQKYTHYRKANGSWGEFKKLVIRMPKPTSKSPGWGYAVEKKDNTRVADAAAETILQDFETGKLTLDQLFKKMNVELYSIDGGAKMIPHATVVFTRGAGGDPWKLTTQYPNKDIASIGWEPFDSPPANMTFKHAGGQDALSTTAMP